MHWWSCVKSVAFGECEIVGSNLGHGYGTLLGLPFRRPVRAPGCKNGPASFPGRMSYKATKPGLISVLYLSMFFIVLVFIRAPFYVLLVFIVCFLSFGCSS